MTNDNELTKIIIESFFDIKLNESNKNLFGMISSLILLYKIDEDLIKNLLNKPNINLDILKKIIENKELKLNDIKKLIEANCH